MIFFKIFQKIHLTCCKTIAAIRSDEMISIYSADANMQLQFTLEVYEMENKEKFIKVSDKWMIIMLEIVFE